MASLVEIQDATQAVAQSSYLQDSGDCCDVHALDTIMSGLQQLPTPPLSPDSSASSGLPYPVDIDQVEANMEDQDAEALLDHMLKCEQIPTFEETDTFTDSQTSFTSSTDLSDVLICTDAGAALLIQDCMWNSHAYEPRNLIGNGVYTPAPSPPPSTSEKSIEEEQDAREESPMDEDKQIIIQASDVQADCISPCDIFPTYTLMTDKGPRLASKPRSNTSESDSARHQRATSSESDEEIDVVTVSERVPARMSTRKRPFSVSAPCSRHTSPTPPSPKKRKYTVKRIQRINSTCSSVGDGTESDDEHRRASHNILERKRRNDLKYSFQVLREQVPELEDNQRAPKVTILRKAAEYIRRIQFEGDAMEQELEKERKREAKLRQRLAFLKAMSVVR